MVKRLLELIRGDQAFFEKDFPELTRHSRTPTLSGMTFDVRQQFSAFFVASWQVAEIHALNSNRKELLGRCQGDSPPVSTSGWAE
jgi:hypothetical protein